VFLHSVKEGPANQSYGLQVAALAGIPKSVTSEARRYLSELERERDALRNSVSAHSQLPLFGVPAPDDSAPEKIDALQAAHAAAVSATLEALRSVDPNELSPREALDLVFRLQQLDRTASGR
jgi:DNA mismatch repair protein MutS